MLEGSVSDQLHQLISSRTYLPLPLSFSPSTTFSPFESYSYSSHHLQSSIFQASNLSKNGGREEELLVPPKLVEQRQRSADDSESSRSSEEVLSLLRIRSTMENWFPEFTWEHVSRKLAEMGFESSAEKCKEKFEEESRYLNDVNFCKNYSFLSELEQELCQTVTNPQIDEKNKKSRKTSGQEEEIPKTVQTLKENSSGNVEETSLKMEEYLKNKKRKKEKKFEVLKVCCEDIVKLMMAQQEEMHNKLLQDMVKRDEQKIAKEEAWKREEMEKMNKELEIMAREQAIACYRQASIIDFLKQFTENPKENQCLNEENLEKLITASSSLVQPQNPKTDQKDSPSKIDPLPRSPSPSHSTYFTKLPTSLNHQNPANSITARKASLKNPNFNKKEPDLGNRWPKDEVLVLINLRCSLKNDGNEKEAVKGPLWERISQGMTELGYQRSSRRCKEKWENINKYFRKTRDSNKKRSLDSRTCPYFHQLNSLYSCHGRSTAAPPANLSNSPENQPVSSLSLSTDSSMHADDQGEKNIASAPNCY